MACATLGLIVLTATLLGQQKLTVNSQGPLPAKTVSAECAKSSTESMPINDDANATLTMKDANGIAVYSRPVSVQTFRYYTNDQRESAKFQGGVFPATSAVMTFRYPVSHETKRAVQLELKLKDGTFQQVANLQVTKSPSAILIGRK